MNATDFIDILNDWKDQANMALDHREISGKRIRTDDGEWIGFKSLLPKHLQGMPADKALKMINDCLFMVSEAQVYDIGEKNEHAVALGRMGGRHGGRSRMANLSPEERRLLARRAANARWHQDGRESQ